MMNYELFKEVILENIMKYMPEQYQECSLELRKVQKINQTKEAIMFKPKDSEAFIISPTLYVDLMYEHYQQCEDLQEVFEEVVKITRDAIEKEPDIKKHLNYENAKEQTVMALINTEQNKELLEQLPHREFQDLSIIYRWVVEKNEDGIFSAIIDNDIAKQMGMDEQALYSAAVRNTKQIFPPLIKTIDEVILEMFIKEGMPEETLDDLMDTMKLDSSVYVLSNQYQMNGAVAMLYKNELYKLAEKLGNDLYIMPSSIHEVVIIEAKGDPNELAYMVNEINMDTVAMEERLSNQVYHYDKDLRKLTLTTNTPNKRLDGTITEKNMTCESKQR